MNNQQVNKLSSEDIHRALAILEHMQKAGGTILPNSHAHTARGVGAAARMLRQGYKPRMKMFGRAEMPVVFDAQGNVVYFTEDHGHTLYKCETEHASIILSPMTVEGQAALILVGLAEGHAAIQATAKHWDAMLEEYDR